MQLDPLDSSGDLPDTLDIGDVYEPRPSAEVSSVKPKTAGGEASTSSGSLAPDTVGLRFVFDNRKKIKDLMRSWIEVVPVLFSSSHKTSNSLALETITEEEAKDREDNK
ncbi:hypothetical protein SADUNF_Sadunf06G0198000 [Salix dunnii]|uniref:Uncharacterized protein n=1 Tax=Salix dunnii TaxID=1413687 RepID=A0A835N3A3_9ROSI|nr:hypothetical protein SADUNF_Sadunf06G0198000 [Salix dunnii]